MRLKKSLCVLIAFVLPFIACACVKNGPAPETEPVTPPQETVSAVFEANGFVFGGIFAYEGPYVEDGSNETVYNVAAVRVENKNTTALRYAEFTFATGAGDLRFICTTLLPGRSALLLEQGRAPYTGASVSGVSVGSELFFSEPPSLMPEAFSLTVENKVLTLKNISGVPVPGETYVYFKRCNEQGYLGGITYRIRFTDIPAGGTMSQSTQNLVPSDCDLIFIECQNPPGANA